jgi:starch synthase (maltosyl-transferring)
MTCLLDHDSGSYAGADPSDFDATIRTVASIFDASVPAGSILAVDLRRFPVDHALVAAHPRAFATRRGGAGDAPVDPRRAMPPIGSARARLRDPDAEHVLYPPIVDRLRQLCDAGASGFRFRAARDIGTAVLARVIADLRSDFPDLAIVVDAADLDDGDLRALSDVGLNGLVTRFDVRDPRSSRALEEYARMRPVAPVLVEVPANAGAALVGAASIGNGLILPAALVETDTDGVKNALATARSLADLDGEMRRLAGDGAKVGALLRTDVTDVRAADTAILVLHNRTSEPQPIEQSADLLEYAGAAFGPCEPVEGGAGLSVPLAAHELRLVRTRRAKPILLAATPSAAIAADAPRLVLEGIVPGVDGGNFAVKRVVGERVPVEAVIFADGHEQLAAELRWRAVDSDDWRTMRMAQLPNDLWAGELTLDRLGRHEFVVAGWLDRFGGFRRDFGKKLDAGVAQPVDHAEGLALVRAAAERATGELRATLAEWAARAEAAAGDPDGSAELLLSPDLAAAMDRADDRPHAIVSPPQSIDAERLQARFSSWYELFPRSMTDDKRRHGSFADVIRQLPRIRDMGFDTLYFPPIHPIGTTNRKGPNNTLTPEPHDVGSPYAIGSAEGGHDAIHPELGTFEDFAKLVEAARAHGLEIAIDFAIQCAPDHPWLKAHPGWFAWRPDGSMKYAENPPKKYQDIVNVDFYGPDAVPGLWLALRDVVLLWAEHGVKTFRVDNPHTKPLPFWEWMIADVRAKHPDAIFLAEAFTRPSMMYRLAKVGFSQSYTYFTWRDGKQELVDYVTELTTTAPKDFYRPHFFVNTPDINPPYLQTSGRPGFRIRAVLAATLSGLFGVYSGFELCESAALPGREEYLDSEKYEIRPRDYAAPGNIVADITLLNRLRRAHPALQTHLNTRFQPAYNDNIIYYAKPEPDGTGMILVMVNLDPHHAQEANFELPLWEFGIPDDGTIAVHDLVGGYRFDWHGKTQWIRLDPSEPYRIWRIAPGDTA